MQAQNSSPPLTAFLQAGSLGASFGKDGGLDYLTNDGNLYLDKSGNGILSGKGGDIIQLATGTPNAAGAASHTATGAPGAATGGVLSPNVFSAADFSQFLSLFEGGALSGLDPATLDWAPGTSMPSAMNGSNMTAVITNTPYAATAHPATQTVAVHLQKTASRGDQQNWTLQLDPPDLGKVQVQMSFTKDKPVKAVILVEKPETWAMLQRDAQILERSLQSAGIETDGGSLSFELASGENAFEQNGRHDGQPGKGGGNNAAGNDDLEIIETTMNWYVDPATGVQRYNLLV
jgi:hypothetical protein